MGMLISLLVLSFLIFFHELGHFLAARLFGVKVETFSIGFGKKLVVYTHRGTEYCLSAVPLGGYVKMKGQDDFDPSHHSPDLDSYNTQAPWRRTLILLAGPMANFLLAFLLYLGVGLLGHQELSSVVGKVQEGSPAAGAGLREGDKILFINGVETPTWKMMSRTIEQSEGALELRIARGGRTEFLVLQPRVMESRNLFGETIQKRMIGIGPKGETLTIHEPPEALVGYALGETYEAASLILKGIQKLIEGVVPTSEIGGVVSIVQITSEASGYGVVALLSLTALISVNLGVLNLLPIPALDGGHIMFNIYEMATRKAPSEAVLYRLTLGGWVILGALMLLGLYNDINRLSAGAMP